MDRKNSKENSKVNSKENSKEQLNRNSAENPKKNENFIDTEELRDQAGGEEPRVGAVHQSGAKEQSGAAKLSTVLTTVDPDREKEALNSAIYPFAQMIEEAGIVAFPTETVYGLGADALNPVAIEKIFIAKGRPSDNPLIVHIAEEEGLFDLVEQVPEKAIELMAAFWPGPLTMIFKKRKIIPDIVTAGGGTVAIRMPDHPVAQALIEISGTPLVAPSANASGKPSPTKAEHVLEDLNGKIHGIIDGGSCAVGIESTVIDMTEDPPVLLRPGGITQRMIEEIIGPIERDEQLDRIDQGKSAGGTQAERTSSEKAPADPLTSDPLTSAPLHSDQPKESLGKVRSPGMKYTHYAPRAQVLILRGKRENVLRKMKALLKEYREAGRKVGIITMDENLSAYETLEELQAEANLGETPYIRSLGSQKDVEGMAANLFTILREFDRTDVEIILAEALEDREMGYAIMNRLSKAAGQNILYVDEEDRS